MGGLLGSQLLVLSLIIQRSHKCLIDGDWGQLTGLAPGSNTPSPHSFSCMAQEEELIQSENSASIFNTLSDIPSQIQDAELLLGEAMQLAGCLTDVAVETQRRKHLAYLIADQGPLLGTSATTSLSQVGLREEAPPHPELGGGFPGGGPK